MDRSVIATLAGRSSAVLHHDRRAFLETVAVGADRQAQLDWFERMGPLPLAAFKLELASHDPAGSTPGHYRALVSELVQLDGYDPAPALSRHEIELVLVGGRWQVASDTLDKSELNDVPWYFPGTSVTFGDHVAVVTDAADQSRASDLVRVAEAARDHDGQVIPDGVASLGGVIVLAFSDPAGLRAQGLDTHEIQGLGGLAVPVRDAHGLIIERRAVIAPVMLDRDALSLDIVMRHELAHVALTDYHGPRWVIEGIADYVAWSGQPRVYLPERAISAAVTGIAAMPVDAYFFQDASLDYGVAWFAMRSLAQLDGSDEPFRLLQAMSKVSVGDAVRTDDAERVLQQRYGFGRDALAARAGLLINQVFGDS